jgi:single-strand DNA-binding protein
MNSINIIGRLTEDPQRIPAETLGVSMRLAFDQPGDTGYVDVALWERNAQACLEHMHKGDELAVCGRLNYRSWTSKDGAKRSALNVSATHVGFLRKAKRTAA